MGVKAWLSKPLAYFAHRKVSKWASKALTCQEEILISLVHKASETQFGKDHTFDRIKSYSDFKQAVPVRDYEALKPYVERVVEGESDVLWPGRPVYFSKTSGTTSGAKYIPITRESMPHHIEAARNALLLYIAKTGKSGFVDGKMIFLQGSPVLEEVNGIPTGRLSGIVAHHVPSYLQKNRLPSFETNAIEDWETKVDAIVDETKDLPMSLISGIPSWVQHYFEKLIETTGKKTIREIFPTFQLFVYGGVNYEPYRPRFEALIGDQVDSIETYPASEGFIAFQNDPEDRALLLNVNGGIFFEFIPVDQYFEANPPRLSLHDVEIGVNYALVLSTNAGLWGYDIGDTVKFTSLDPYKILVTGRIKHFTSAFGEHVIAEEVEGAMNEALGKFPAEVIEFHVAPELNPKEGLPYHEWFIAFERLPEDMGAFAGALDEHMQERNIYYADLVKGKILRPLRITCLTKNAFNEFMKSKGKLGGQNKVPRLSDNRSVADELIRWRNSCS
jgi:hypothetical protein